MSKNIKEERFRWISPIINKEITIVNLLKVCPYSESSIKRWLRTFREEGQKAGIDYSNKYSWKNTKRRMIS